MTPMGKKRRRGVARAVAEVRLLRPDHCAGALRALKGGLLGCF